MVPDAEMQVSLGECDENGEKLWPSVIIIMHVETKARRLRGTRELTRCQLVSEADHSLPFQKSGGRGKKEEWRKEEGMEIKKMGKKMAGKGEGMS